MGSGTSLVLAGGRATMPPIGFDVVCGNSRQRGLSGVAHNSETHVMRRSSASEKTFNLDRVGPAGLQQLAAESKNRWPF